MQKDGKKFYEESLDLLSPEFSRLLSSVLARTRGTTEAQDNPSFWDKTQFCKILSARKRVNRDQLFSTTAKSWGCQLKPGGHSVHKALFYIAKISAASTNSALVSEKSHQNALHQTQVSFTLEY